MSSNSEKTGVGDVLSGMPRDGLVAGSDREALPRKARANELVDMFDSRNQHALAATQR